MNEFNPDKDDEEQPLDPAVERVRARMVRLMLVSVTIMMVGLGAVLFAIIYKATESGGGGGETANFVLSLPEGARIVETSGQGDRLLIRMQTANGQQIWLYDAVQGQVISKVDIQPGRKEP